MADYAEQLNKERRKNQSSGKIKIKLSKFLTEKMNKAVNDGESWVWPLAFCLAVFNDLLDLSVIGSIPILGDGIDIFCAIILTGFLWNIGGVIKWKIRISIWLAGIIEVFLGIIILPEFLPFWTLSIIWAYLKVKKQAELGERGLNNFRKGKLDREAIQAFK